MIAHSHKPISEDEGMQVAKDDLAIVENEEHSLILRDNSYDKEKQEYLFYFMKDEGVNYKFVIYAICR